MQEVNLDSLIESASKNYEPNKVDRMIIISRPGVGKTRALMQLPNSIYFDLEDSTGHFQGNAEVINISKIKDTQGWGPVTTIKNMTNHIKSKGKKYRFCIVDTISIIDDIAEPLALINYKNTALGKNFKEDTIFALDFGGGYYWHREAFQEIISCFEGIADTLILVAHVKDSSIKKGGESTSVLDLRLTGTLREIMSSKQDASGVLIFDKKDPDKRFLDFRKSEENTFMKCRPEHLAGKIVEISQLKDGKFETSWENVFPDLKSKK